MCGICGSLNFGGSSDEDSAAILRLMKLMERRGPDDSGLWSDDRHVALGFQRLSILDLSPAGHQPMITPDGRYAVVYNGEVYNFRELREDLSKSGVRFRSSGDTEVVLNALATWGKDALSRFNGMFALALYNVPEKRMLLARDYAGIKPLYFMLSPEGIVFGSQYNQIMSHPWARRLDLSPRGLALYLRLGYIPAPYAVLQNTHMLEPGSWLEVGIDGRIASGKFFEFPDYTEPDLRGEEASDAVNQAIRRAVRRHLISDVPVGTFLSGGIDSPLVAANMKTASHARVPAFTVGTDGDESDESADAAAYAAELGLDHTVEQATPKSAFQMLDSVIDACSEPFADYSIFPTMLVAGIARRSVKVVLSGDGGDELFWGYPSRLLTPIKYAAEFRRPQWSRTVRWGFDRVLTQGNGRIDLRYKSIGDFYRSAHCRIDETTLADLFPDLDAWPQECVLFNYNGCDPDRAAQWLRWNEFVSHLTMVLLKVDRASMYQSLEVRIPLLDREVVELACRVDWRSCLDLSTGEGKLPLRKALSRHVRHQTHRKRGFEVPMKLWLKGPLKDIFHEAVIDRNELVGMQLNRGKVRKIFQEHTAGYSDNTRTLWTLLSLALWEKKHYRRNGYLIQNLPLSTFKPAAQVSP